MRIRFLWDTLLDAATDDERRTLVAEADVMWSYFEVVVDAFAQAYADEGEIAETAGVSWSAFESLHPPTQRRLHFAPPDPTKGISHPQRT